MLNLLRYPRDLLSSLILGTQHTIGQESYKLHLSLKKVLGILGMKRTVVYHTYPTLLKNRPIVLVSSSKSLEECGLNVRHLLIQQLVSSDVQQVSDLYTCSRQYKKLAFHPRLKYILSSLVVGEYDGQSRSLSIVDNKEPYLHRHLAVYS